MTVKERLKIIKKELGDSPVLIIAVTKFATTEQVIEAYKANLTNFGENKVQNFENRLLELPEEIVQNVNWHFLGHLQTNKVKKVVGAFKLIHSVDTIKLAEIISKEAQLQNVIQEILLEVNISKEASKYGFLKEDIIDLFPEISNLENIKIKGLMTMAPYTSDISVQRDCFRELKILKDHLSQTYNYSLSELSMGMSNDYKLAIQEGSTIIRIGSNLFA